MNVVDAVGTVVGFVVDAIIVFFDGLLLSKAFGFVVTVDEFPEWVR